MEFPGFSSRGQDLRRSNYTGRLSQRHAGSGPPAAPLRSAAQAGDPADNAVGRVPSRGGIYDATDNGVVSPSCLASQAPQLRAAAGAGRIQPTKKQERGQPCPRVSGFRSSSRGQGCPRSNLPRTSVQTPLLQALQDRVLFFFRRHGRLTCLNPPVYEQLDQLEVEGQN